jgi:hypothetical protein
MKKGVLVCAAVLLLAALVPAAQVTFNFGVRAGMTMANNKWTDDDGLEHAVYRPTFGVFADINLTDMIALQPEINYVSTGEWWDDDGKVVEKFDYVHVPLLLKARLMKEGKVVPFLLAGPYVGFLLSAKEGGEDVKQFFKSTDFGADFGGGVEFAVGKMKVLVDVRYLLGLANAFNFGAGSMKNMAFMFTVGGLF